MEAVRCWVWIFSGIAHSKSETESELFFFKPEPETERIKNPIMRRHEISPALFLIGKNTSVYKQNLSKSTCFTTCAIAMLSHFSLLFFVLFLTVLLD